MTKKKSIWKKSVDKHDYDAALDYLTLIYNPEDAEILIEKLKNTKITIRKSKDIRRASGLELFPEDNKHVKENIKKIKRGILMSPMLLVVDLKLIIADGAHRESAVFYTSEDEDVKCVIVYR